MDTTTISSGADLATLINVFTVAPERQRELVQALDSATRELMRHQQGFVSATIHASTDGARVVNYAQWASEEAFHAALGRPEVRAHLTEVQEIMDSSEPRLFTVESVHR